MAQHTINGWIVMSVPDEFDRESRVSFLTYKPSGECFVGVREHSFEIELEDGFDPRPAAVEALRAKRQKVLAEAQKEAVEIDERIQTLLAIEYTPEAA